MFFALRIAVRFLLHRKMQTILTILGISIGVSVQIFVGLLSQGLEGTLLNKVLGYTPHITVNSPMGAITDWQEQVAKIKGSFPDLIISPVVDHQVYIRLDKMNVPALFRGFNIEDADRLYNIDKSIYEGSFPQGPNEVLIGKELKERLGVKIGDSINIVTFGGKMAKMIVSGIYDFNVAKINSSWLITNLATAQELTGIGDRVTTIEIGLSNPSDADVIGQKLKDILDSGFNVTNWKDQNQLLVSGIVGQKIVSLAIQFLILLGTVFGILNILTVNVIQKIKQLGILKALGCSNRIISLIFFLEAILLGLPGTGLGAAFALLLLRGFQKFIVSSQGIPLINVVFNIKFVQSSVILMVIASAVAGIYPAIRSVRLNSIEVIKNG